MADDETIYRLIVTPGDIDDQNRLLSTSLAKAGESGLSVFRSNATDEDIVNLVADRLSVKPGQDRRRIVALWAASVTSVREISRTDFGRLFCIYDETVPRKVSGSDVPSHATVLQRLPPPGTPGGKNIAGQDRLKLFRIVQDSLVDIANFRDGIIEKLNERAAKGDFDLDEHGHFKNAANISTVSASPVTERKIPKMLAAVAFGTLLLTIIWVGKSLF